MEGAFDLDNALTTQRIFRHIMYSFSYPLKVYNIFDGADNGSPDGENATLVELCGVFLDNTVSLYVHDDARLAAEIRETTYVRLAAIEDADYVILKDTHDLNLLEKVSAGSLINPHKGATLIIIIPRIEGTARFIAEGPGINGRISVSADPAIADCLYKVADLNIEYPQGFDILFLTGYGDICAVPRHIEIHREEAVRWHM